MNISLDLVATFSDGTKQKLHKDFDLGEYNQFASFLWQGNYALKQLSNSDILSPITEKLIDKYYDLLEEITEIHKIDIIQKMEKDLKD